MDNPGFSGKDFEPWHFGLTEKYGYELEPKVSKGEITFPGIKKISPKYVTFSQFIGIEMGKKYVLKFDAKLGEDSSGEPNVSIGRPGFARADRKGEGFDHLASEKFTPETDWKTFSFLFTGTYNTGNKEAMKSEFKAGTF